MSGYLNKVQLIGRLGRSPEVRNTQDGKKVGTLSIATSETWMDKTTHERQKKTEWHKVVIFNERLCDIAEQYLKKGSHVYLEGQLQTRKWTDKEGKERSTTEVVLQKYKGEITMLDGKEPNEGGGYIENTYDDNTHTTHERDTTKTHSMKDFDTGLDDEIPF